MANKWKDLHIRINEKIHEELKEIAKEKDLSISALVRSWIYKKVKRERKNNEKK